MKESERPAEADRTGIGCEVAARDRDASTSTERTRWIRSGRSVVISGKEINGGMVYVGESQRRELIPDPCLIDPALPVDWDSHSSATVKLTYWPSYTLAPPRARATYLRWLAEGRTDKIDIGYVFLFFYGLERRILHDLEQAHPEVVEIAAEVRRLVKRYGRHRSFKNYSENLNDVLLGMVDKKGRIIHPHTATPTRRIETLVRAGSCLARGRPVPRLVAYAYTRKVLASNENASSPSVRCEPEFSSLFAFRYRSLFGAGLRITRPTKRTKRLSVAYRTASNGRWSDGEVTVTFSRLPDPRQVKELNRTLRDLWEGCKLDLNGYNRWVARHGHSSAAAGSFLPEPVMRRHSGVRNFQRWVTRSVLDHQVGGLAVIPVSALMRAWTAPNVMASPPRVLTESGATRMCTVLSIASIGAEPDPRFGVSSISVNGNIVLYPEPDEIVGPRRQAVMAVRAFVYLSAAVFRSAGGMTDGQQQLILDEIGSEQFGRLTDSEVRRLCAYAEYLFSRHRLGTASLRRIAAAMALAHRPRVAASFVKFVERNGIVDLSDSYVERLLANLGLDPDTVRELLNEVPAPRTQLDRAKIRRRLEETARVSEMLASIFDDEEESDVALVGSVVSESADASASQVVADEGRVLPGLDGPATELALTLMSRPSWRRDVAATTAIGFGFPVLDGVLEIVNDAAFDVAGEPLTEGEDPIVINDYTSDELQLLLGSS